MAEIDSVNKKAIFDKVVAALAGKTQGEKWAYFDARPGTQEIFWEFRFKTAASEELKSFASAAQVLGLGDTVESIDKATEGLGPDEYVNWLNKHPSAKQALIKIDELREQLNSTKK